MQGPNKIHTRSTRDPKLGQSRPYRAAPDPSLRFSPPKLPLTAKVFVFVGRGINLHIHMYIYIYIHMCVYVYRSYREPTKVVLVDGNILAPNYIGQMDHHLNCPLSKIVLNLTTWRLHSVSVLGSVLQFRANKP